MKPVKILHCADLHLGPDLHSTDERTGELLATFRNITTLCRERQIDLLLIAGDLFDRSSVHEDLARSVKEYLAECPARTFIAPGNHDYVAPDSVYRDQDWPDRVHIFKGDLQAVDLEDLPVTVWGAGFERSFITSPLEFPVDIGDPARIQICLIHGDLVSERGKSDYRPITRQTISRSGMDYVALGHIHQASDLERAGKTFFAYPGCPDGRGFDETGLKGVLAGQVGKAKVIVEFVPTSSRLYLIEEVRLPEREADGTGPLQSEKDVADYLAGKIREMGGDNWRENYYRLAITGPSRRSSSVFLDNVQRRLQEEEIIREITLLDDTDPPVDIHELMGETTLRGIFTRRILEEMEKNRKRKDLYQLALRYGLRAFEGEVSLHDS